MFSQPKLKFRARGQVCTGCRSAGFLQVPPKFLASPRPVRQTKNQQQLQNHWPEICQLQGQEHLVHALMDDVPKHHQRQMQVVLHEHRSAHVVSSLTIVEFTHASSCYTYYIRQKTKKLRASGVVCLYVRLYEPKKGA